MGKAIVFAAVSLDGYVARDDDSVGPLFDWYGNGDVEVTFSDESGSSAPPGPPPTSSTRPRPGCG